MDRVTLPIVKTLSGLLVSTAVLDEVLENNDQEITELITRLRTECQDSLNNNKITSVLSVMCELLRVSSPVMTKQIITHVTLFLSHQYPKVRDIAATTLLTAM
ncbi:hypothetical protein Pmani_009297 [Petrolisthes manimaculis]|uniref:Uncharacterized protein n=1 Tax=Petrolisthes manimaculis TaxID=1843537 RepID=A0AAE1Q585_9EUCA|nr:hypothetical protein Pmani_009297 [Petrolisthes manimaculis]